MKQLTSKMRDRQTSHWLLLGILFVSTSIKAKDTSWPRQETCAIVKYTLMFDFQLLTQVKICTNFSCYTFFTHTE